MPRCAEYVADFYLQYIVPEKNHYNAQKAYRIHYARLYYDITKYYMM